MHAIAGSLLYCPPLTVLQHTSIVHACIQVALRLRPARSHTRPQKALHGLPYSLAARAAQNPRTLTKTPHSKRSKSLRSLPLLLPPCRL